MNTLTIRRLSDLEELFNNNWISQETFNKCKEEFYASMPKNVLIAIDLNTEKYTLKEL